MIKSPAKKQGILYLSDGRNLAPLLLNISSFQRLALRMKQKALQGRELEVPCDSERATSAFRYI